MSSAILDPPLDYPQRNKAHIVLTIPSSSRKMFQLLRTYSDSQNWSFEKDVCFWTISIFIDVYIAEWDLQF